MFPCEFLEIFRNKFFYRTHPVAASVIHIVNIGISLNHGFKLINLCTCVLLYGLHNPILKFTILYTTNTQENTCTRVSFSVKLLAEACNFIKKETLAQVFSCEFCEIFKNFFLQNASQRLLLIIIEWF